MEELESVWLLRKFCKQMKCVRKLMATRERADSAFRATRALGIPDKEVKPVLIQLLKVFENNWEPIEAEDYRALLDAYFEAKETKRVEYEKRVRTGAVSERSSKKLHLEQQEDQVSSSKDTLNPVESSSSQCSLQSTDLIASQVASKDTTSKRTSCIGSPNQLKPGCSHLLKEKVPDNYYSRELIKPRSKLIVSDMADFPEPTAMVHPSAGSFRGSSNGNSLPSHRGSQCDASDSHLIASSALGKVKILLNSKSAVRQQNFKIPDLDAVLKFLEDKYIRAYKLVAPEFSVKTLLKDLCECYIELGKRHVTNCTVPNNRALRIGNYDMVVEKKASSSCEFSKFKFPHRATACDQKRSIRHIIDITKGTENVKISLVDEIGNEDVPDFTYMPQNIIYQNAYLQISLARIADEDCCSSCSGDCLSSQIPCACAGETGGEFAYTQEGLLKDAFLTACVWMERNPQKDHLVFCQECPLERSKNEYQPEKCKGHLLRKFIKECWRKCGCNMSCGNRVVQRGIACNLQVFMTHQDKGWGLRTLQDLPKGSFVCEYVGEILTNTELYERNVQNRGGDRHTYPVTLDADWGSEKVLRDEEALCLDATFCGNVARFINHRCHDENLIDIPVEVETPDRHYYHLAFFTTRNVSALEELTWDYGIDFNDHAHPIKAFQCCCGSQCCRDLNRRGA